MLSNVCLSFAADPAIGFKGMNDKVEELIKSIPNSHCLNQITNPANPEAHFKWTGTYIGESKFSCFTNYNYLLSKIMFFLFLSILHGHFLKKIRT